MEMKQFLEYLKNRSACEEGVKFTERYETPQEAWDACENSNWMSWLLRRTLRNPNPEQHKSLVRIACEAARLALPAVKFGELRPLRAIEAAEAWICGKATKKVVAAEAAEATCTADATDAAASACAHAAYAAAHAASACAHASESAVHAAFAADAAAYHAAYACTNATYATYAADYESDVAVQKQIANIIRRYFPDVVKLIS